MSSNAYKLILRVVFAFCAAAVMLAAMPHHHHDSSEAVCFNPMHCFTHSDSHNHSCDHDHCTAEHDSTGEPSSCHLKIDVAEVISNLSKQTLLPPVQLQTIIVEPLELLALARCEADDVVDRPNLSPDPAQRIVCYIARALPTRAATERA